MVIRAKSQLKRAGCLILSVSLVVPIINSFQLVHADDNTLLGAYCGRRNQGLSIKDTRCMEEWLGKKLAVVSNFTSFDTPMRTKFFGTQLSEIWANNNVPVITWEARYWFQPTPKDIQSRIIRGEYDLSVFESWADKMKEFLEGPDRKYGTSDDRRAYLLFAHEMNGAEFPWGASAGENATVDYVKMWKHVWTLFKKKGIDNTRLQWIWCVNHTDSGKYKAEDYYPGDQYVDWVAINGLNWGKTKSDSEWLTAEQIFNSARSGMISRLRALTKRPLAITLMSSTSCQAAGQSGDCIHNTKAKEAWITEAYNYLTTKGAKMIVWFNEEKETDWPVLGASRGDGEYRCDGSRYTTFESFKKSVQGEGFHSADPNNPRLLTDRQFSGQF